jgi:predicted CoA-binding protein
MDDAPSDRADDAPSDRADDAPSDRALHVLLSEVRSIAVIGIKADPNEAAARVPAYLQRAGYRILPVSPKLERVLGERCVPCLADLGEAPDLIDVFRAVHHLPGHVDEILQLATLPRAVWFQEGIRDDASAARLAAAGIAVVQDRCLMVEHARLEFARPPAPTTP